MEKTDGKQTVRGKFTKGNDVGKKFQKGETGNPNGRPKRTRLTDALREQLQEVLPEAPEQTIAERIADALIQKALSGDVQAIREIGDRTEGKPAQKLDIDMNVHDWRQLARTHGLSETDVINEARQLIESADDSSGE